MRDLLHAGRALFLDMASTVLFLAVYLPTRNVRLAGGLSIALALAQVGRQFVRKKPVDAMQWVSLIVVLASSTASSITRNATFVMLKPSLIYVSIGVVMLKPGWMNRYLPPIALDALPDVVVIFGYLWAGLMFLSAVLNVAVAVSTSVVVWAAVMAAYAIVSKAALFLIQYAAMRFIGARRRRDRLAREAAA